MEREQNKRPRRTSLEIKNLLSSFTQSGLSVKAFCQIHSISEAAFYKWKSRYTVTPSENQAMLCLIATVDQTLSADEKEEILHFSSNMY